MIRFITLFIVVLAAFVFAGEGNFNYYGQFGFHKTQSAQTLGHGRFGVGLFGEGTGLHDMIGTTPGCNHGQIAFARTGEEERTCYDLGATYMGMNAYPFISLGLSEYFDFGISMPVYGEIIQIDHPRDGGNTVGLGDVQILTKWRVPLDDSPFDFALIIGASLGTGFNDYYRLWIRDPSFLNLSEDSTAKTKTYAYTNGNPIFKVGGAATLDFNRLRAEIPVLVHLNYFYRMALGSNGGDYPRVMSFSTAVEWTPIRFISLLGELYMDMPSAFPKINNLTEEDYAATSTLTFGTAFHFSKYVDLQLGFQMLAGDSKKYIDSLAVPIDNSKNLYGYYSASLIPKYLAYGGLTFKIFAIEPEHEEEETRNPDTDGDGVCDPWVARENKQRDYIRYCKGIDLCPYEEGPIENKGCPEEEAEEDAPTIMFDASEESISSGQSINLRWVVANASEVRIDGIGDVDAEGRKRIWPKETTKYTLTAIGPGGKKTKTIEVVVESAPGPSIVFNANQDAVQKGQLVTLTWMVSEATQVNIEGIGKVDLKGSRRVKPEDVGITTFTLTATGPGGTKTESIEIEVLAGPLPTILFTASAETIQSGQTVTLNWQVSNAANVSIEGIGKVPAKGTKRMKPTESAVYTLTAVGDGGTQTATVEVEVEAPVIEDRVNLKGVTFGSGNATLTPNAKKVLDDIAEQLKASPRVKIEIQGHTDNQGNSKANQDLSERRAKAVVGYLAIQGVPMSRMRAVGFGQDSPIADNKTKEGRELNRRIEMIKVD